MKRVYCVLFVCFAMVSFAWSVPATPNPIERVLPDGTVQSVYLRGDENAHFLTTLDGEYIEGTYAGPANTTYKDRLNASQRVALSSYLPNKGEVHIPVILVNFTDLSFSMSDPVAQVDDLFNGAGGTNPSATGSVATYFAASSCDQLKLVFHVYGPYTLSNEMAYYGGNVNGNDKNPRALVAEAARLASDAGVDFSIFDNNNDGYVDNISIITAGHNEAEGADANTIWPHYSTAGSTASFNGKYLSGYLIISEYSGRTGTVQAGIGTYCHEFGHALGLPDLYNTVDGSIYTVGSWDIMCSGPYNNNGCTPPSYTAFERFAMEWLVPEQLTSPSTYQLEPIETSNKAYLVAADVHNLSPMSPVPNEYFLLENRQKVGWDANDGALVGTGLMVSHITFNYTKWQYNTFNNSTPLGFAIVSAYLSNPTSSTPSDLFPGTGNITTWLPTYNSGATDEEQLVSNIRLLDGEVIAFRYGVQGDNGFFCSPNPLDLVTTYDFGIYEYFEDSVMVTCKGIVADTAWVSVSSSYFEYSLDGGTTWNRYLVRGAVPIRSEQLDSFCLYVRYVPGRQECTSRSGLVSIETDDHAYDEMLQVRGTAPRPTYIQSPTVLAPADLSSTSFRAQWEPEEDAEFYYVTLYSLENTPSAYDQDFETFDDATGITDVGWSANFVRTTQTVSESGKSVLFTATGEQLITSSLPIAPSRIRVWLSNNYTVTSGSAVGGTLNIDARTTDGDWERLDVVEVVGTTKNLSKEILLQKERGYVQFRFSYVHKGGNGGVALDGFVATLDYTLDYICQGTEREVSGSSSSVIFTGLTPGTTYYFAVSAYEYKGCEEHYTALSPAQAVTTLADIDANAPWVVQRSDEGEYFVQLPEPSDGNRYLYIYSFGGALVHSMRIPYGTTKLDIPTAQLTKGNIYILKQIETKLQRKTSYGKMLYY